MAILNSYVSLPSPIFVRPRRGRCPEQGIRSPASHSASRPARRSHGTAACAACACAADTGGARWDLAQDFS